MLSLPVALDFSFPLSAILPAIFSGESERYFDFFLQVFPLFLSQYCGFIFVI